MGYFDGIGYNINDAFLQGPEYDASYAGKDNLFNASAAGALPTYLSANDNVGSYMNDTPPTGGGGSGGSGGMNWGSLFGGSDSGSGGEGSGWGALIGAAAGYFGAKSKEKANKQDLTLREQLDEKKYAAQLAEQEKYYQAHGQQLASAMGNYAQYAPTGPTKNAFSVLGHTPGYQSPYPALGGG